MTTRNLSCSDNKSQTGYLTWTDSRGNQVRELGEFLSIGRDAGNQIQFSDEYLSARHARFERRDQVFFLRDLRSRNGTFVNGARILEAVLNDGDRIQIGCQELTFSFARKSTHPQPYLLSKNSFWRDQLERLPSIAQSGYPLLLTGPSGAGKDVIAQAVHKLSQRSNGAFVSVNCGALSPSLVESELFGHVRGSFTGATNDRKGAFEAARGGTLFLDEIGDLPIDMQPKLLRALENTQIRPVGSDKVIATNVRIITATHQDLKCLVRDGAFRSDLYFRLHVLQLRVPALADRLEDFDDLFYRIAMEQRVRFSFDAIARLKEHSWPGNIRELRNVITRARALFASAEVKREHVEVLIDTIPAPVSVPSSPLSASGRPIIKEIEMEMIKSRLKANQGNQRLTAFDLGMAKSTLHDRIRSYGINIDVLLGRKI